MFLVTVKAFDPTAKAANGEAACIEEAINAAGAAADAPIWQRRLGGSGSWRVDYADIREDRVVFYGSVGKDVMEISYKVRATNIGQFVMPASYGEAMNDRRIFARSAGEAFTVVKRWGLYPKMLERNQQISVI